MFKFLAVFLIISLKIERITGVSCFSCDWYADYPTVDERCGWDNQFTVPKNQSDNSVKINCEKCAIGLVRKDDKVNEIVRRCITDLGNEEWAKEANYCSYEPLVGGLREFCYCDNDYCNENNRKVASVCDMTTTRKNVEIREVNRKKKATTIKCYQCLWKKGQSSGPFNPKCGYGDNFTVPIEDAIENCNTCYLRLIMKGDDLQEIDRGCTRLISGEEWKVHNESCSTQPLNGGKDEFCYCSENFCNVNADSFPAACDSYVQETTTTTIITTKTSRETSRETSTTKSSSVLSTINEKLLASLIVIISLLI